MREAPLRVGILGAGANTRGKHIPLLQKIPGVEVVAVCNRGLESARRVCAEFKIPRAVEKPEDIFADGDLDAVVIGTWPDKHCEFTLQALAHDKHVLCEARMAMDEREAQRMLEAAHARPQLVTQVVPAPFTLPMDGLVRARVEAGIGQLLAVHIFLQNGAFPDGSAPQSWRQTRRTSGNNIMMVGIFYEAMMRWVGPARTVFATLQTAVAASPDPATGRREQNDVPDAVQALGRLVRDNADFCLLAANTHGLRKETSCWIYGSEGTLAVLPGQDLLFGKRGGRLTSLKHLWQDKPGWRVEEEFVGAIRGREQVRFTTFADGCAYMRFTDALHASARTGRAVEI